MESERNSIFSHAQSQSQGSKIRSQHGDESQRKNQYSMKNQQNEEAYMDDGGFQGKGKKIDIKKLIEQKQARQQKQKGVEVKEKNEIQKYYKKTDHSIIETCTICGYIIFTSDAQAKQQKKLAHLKIEHPQYSGIHKSNITCEQNTDEYVNIASQLVNFARDANNREQMQYIVGQYFPKKFQPYVQQLPIDDSLKKWTKLVEYAYKIYQ